MKLHSQKGFTLLEVIIFTTMLSIVLVTAAAFTTRLVYNLRINEHKLYANAYATEVLEWLSSEREATWENVYNMAANSPGRTFCVNENIEIDTVSSGASTFPTGTCDYAGITGRPPSIFKRELIMVRNSDDVVTATVRVSWEEEDTLYVDEAQSVYTSY